MVRSNAIETVIIREVKDKFAPSVDTVEIGLVDNMNQIGKLRGLEKYLIYEKVEQSIGLNILQKTT